MTTPQILDPACASRMFYFDKEDERVLFSDCRDEEHKLCDGRMLKVHPDQVADFRALPHEDETFHLIIFDPPHLERAGPQSWQAAKYGKLNKETWREDLAKGFDECWRVLAGGGTMIFKWNETQIKVSEILSCFSQSPICGHRTTRNLKTHWQVFYKPVAGGCDG